MQAESRIEGGLKIWSKPPPGYEGIGPEVKIEPGDVQKLSDNKYSEYPANGCLVGHYRGAGGTWFRKLKETTANVPPVPAIADVEERIERAARAMAKAAGWHKWDTAVKGRQTLSGKEPREEREHFRDMARAAFAVFVG